MGRSHEPGQTAGLRRLFNWWRSLLLIMMGYENAVVSSRPAIVVTALSCID
jgi:hypothetical protein